MKSSMLDLAHLHQNRVTLEDMHREGVVGAGPTEGRSSYKRGWCESCLWLEVNIVLEYIFGHF